MEEDEYLKDATNKDAVVRRDKERISRFLDRLRPFEWWTTDIPHVNCVLDLYMAYCGVFEVNMSMGRFLTLWLDCAEEREKEQMAQDLDREVR